MIISNEFPPNIEKIRKVFTLRSKSIVFTYGYILYNPGNGYIDKPLMVHEETHARQQAGMGVDKWWDKYLVDKEFRLSQEIEAYRNQYNEAKKYTMNRNAIFIFLKRIALDLSGEMYGNIIDFHSAMERIRIGELK